MQVGTLKTDILCCGEPSSLLLRNKYSASFLYSNLPRITAYLSQLIAGIMDGWIRGLYTFASCIDTLPFPCIQTYSCEKIQVQSHRMHYGAILLCNVPSQNKRTAEPLKTKLQWKNNVLHALQDTKEVRHLRAVLKVLEHGEKHVEIRVTWFTNVSGDIRDV